MAIVKIFVLVQQMQQQPTGIHQDCSIILSKCQKVKKHKQKGYLKSIVILLIQIV